MIIVEVFARGGAPPRPTVRRRRDQDLMRVTILVVPLQHRFAGTSRSRRRARFIPMPASAGGRSRTSPQSGHRVQKQRPIRNHQRLSALSDLRKTIPGYSRSDAKSP